MPVHRSHLRTAGLRSGVRAALFAPAAMTLAVTLAVAVQPPRPRPAADLGAGLWVSPAQIAALPMSGSGWDQLSCIAEAPLGTADISDQDSTHDVFVYAAALVYARTGDERYARKARDGILAAIGTESAGRTLALGRNLPSYVIAADVMHLHSFDPEADARFRAWLHQVRTETLDDRTLISTQEDRPNNWGTHAGAARIAVARYLGDRADLDRAATVMRGWLGDLRAYDGFKYSELDWQADPSAPVGINPKGAARLGHSIDGVLPDDQRRTEGGFTWPPPKENYVWEALQGAAVAAALLDRAGYDAWHWSDDALLRAVRWLHEQARFPAEGDDTWLPLLVDHAYGTDWPGGSGIGKNMAFTAWTHPHVPWPRPRDGARSDGRSLLRPRCQWRS